VRKSPYKRNPVLNSRRKIESKAHVKNIKKVIGNQREGVLEDNQPSSEDPVALEKGPPKHRPAEKPVG